MLSPDISGHTHTLHTRYVCLVNTQHDARCSCDAFWSDQVDWQEEIEELQAIVLDKNKVTVLPHVWASMVWHMCHATCHDVHKSDCSVTRGDTEYTASWPSLSLHVHWPSSVYSLLAFTGAAQCTCRLIVESWAVENCVTLLWASQLKTLHVKVSAGGVVRCLAHARCSGSVSGASWQRWSSVTACYNAYTHTPLSYRSLGAWNRSLRGLKRLF
jgi:hypothetical protein